MRSRSRNLRSGLIAVLASAALLGAVAPPAVAARAPITFLDATQDVLGFRGADIRESAFRDMQQLGVDRARILVWWRDLAPKPSSKHQPAGFIPTDSTTYGPGGARFAGLDAAVRLAVAHGLAPYLVPTGGPSDAAIPRWAAKDPVRGAFDPRPAAYGDFVQALGQRYSGSFDPDGLGEQPVLPKVKSMGIYNEPNNANYLYPQRKRGHAYAPTLYRKLFLQAREGLTAAGWHGQVYIGETAPQGLGQNAAPVEFLRGVLCLNKAYKRRKGCARVKAAAWAHHPYALSEAPWARPRDRSRVSVSVMGRLVTALNRAAGARAITSNLPIYVTEAGYQSVPDHYSGLPLARQAEYNAIAERIAYGNPRVRSYAQYLLRDDASLNAFQTGLRFHGSGPQRCGGKSVGCKPSFRMFQVPLAVRRLGRSGVSIWGHIRPADGPVRVKLRFKDRGHRTRALRSVTTDSTGYFVLKSRYREGRLWGLSWNRTKGPLVRAYRY